MNIKEIEINVLNISTRSKNALYRAKINTIGELVELDEEAVMYIRHIGLKGAEEIMQKIEECKQWIAEGMDFIPDNGGAVDINDALSNAENCNDSDALECGETPIDKLRLSVRSTNALHNAGIYTVAELLNLDDEFIKGMQHVGQKSYDEIKAKIVECRNWFDNSESSSTDADLSNEMVLQYIKANDVIIEQTNLPPRAKHCLERAGYAYLSEIASKDRTEFLSMEGMGAKSADDIVNYIDAYFRSNEASILAYISGDSSALLSEDVIAKKILKTFSEIGFRGLRFKDVFSALDLPESFDANDIKRIIGKLIATNELEYIDYLIYRKYPSIVDYIQRIDSRNDRDIKILQLRLQDVTLEEIGEREGLTRERVRQIAKKSEQRIRSYIYAETGCDAFDEDYYKYLFTNYYVDREVGTIWLGLSNDVYNYLDAFNARGKKDIEEALEDPELEIALKLRIENYINRNNIYIDGRWIRRKRTAIEDYVISNYCRDEISFDDFVILYSKILAELGLDSDDKLAYSEDVFRSRYNRFADSRILLWKTFRRFRYYDIDAYDYSELLEILNLGAYKNTELSTLKFINEYPTLMKQYDIRDQYELHNLLKKIVPEGSYNDIRFNRMPIISFGVCNRDEVVRELLMNNAPISKDNLADLLYEEFGFEKQSSLANFLGCVDEFYHDGMYIVDVKEMTESTRVKLKTELINDFYFIDEVKKIYKNLFPRADEDEINPYNLKKMGFKVFSKCVIQNWASLDSYFSYVLQKENTMDLSEFNSRFCSVTMYWQTQQQLKQEYAIVEYEKNRIISFGKLEEIGITKYLIQEFCDEVYRNVDNGTYFTVHSLVNEGFRSKIFDFGFSEWFYSNLLRYDDRFSCTRIFGQIMLCKGTSNFSNKSFLVDVVNKHRVIEISELLNLLNDVYGCRAEVNSDITEKIKNTDLIYDPAVQRIYANINLYYKELDEEPEYL